MPVCQVCQKDNPAGVEYCEDCGAALATAGGQTTAPAAAPAAPPPQPAPSPPGSGSSASAPAASGGPVSIPVESAGAAPPAAPPSAPATGSAADAPAAPQAAATGQRARLVGMRFGAPTGEEFPLLAERLVVGRFDPETGPVDIDLSASAETAHVSRQHGELYREADGRWFVRDLGSTNGIFVKGRSDASFGPRITAPRPLSNGDELAFGNARFVFRTE